jgi:cell division protein FtsN
VTEKTPAKQKKYLFEFSLSGLVSLFVFSVLIMVWMFILGILVGRGYQPETIIPQLSRILPQEQKLGTPPAPLSAQTVPEVKQQPTLRADELTFHEDLRKPDKRPAPPQVQKAKPTPPKSEPVQPAAAQTIAPPPPKAEPTPAPAAAPETDKFRYIYQVASFKVEDRATAFRDKIRAGGFSAHYAWEPVGEEMWFRVMVTIDGTADETERIKSGLERMGVKNPFLRSKKPL